MPRKQNDKDILFMLDYYHRPLLLFHQDISHTHQDDLTAPHSIRKRFWQLVPDGEYPSEQGRVFLNSYLNSVEDELAKIIRELSLAYCLHLYRRLSPGPVGLDQQPRTIGLTRAVLEAAIQKYARFQLCNKIAESAIVPIEEVFGGLIMAPEFEVEREIIARGNQLVLTDFTSKDLLAFYDLEKLAYEIWRTSAALRTIGKGASLIVCDPPESFGDGRSQELDFLVTNYDKRLDNSDLSQSAAGIVFYNSSALSAAGCTLLPIYNVGGVAGKVTSKDYREFLSKLYRVRLKSDITYNFVWGFFNLREYRKAHLPFATPFYEKYRVSLDAVLVIVAALLSRVLYIWQHDGISAFTRFHQRAYEGPCHKQFILDEIGHFIPVACKILEIDKSLITSDSIKDAMRFWELDTSKQVDIDLSYSGPHYLFLPIQKDQLFIDYAWIFRRLHDLFVGVWIFDQNFKGDALESRVRKGKSILPTKPCIANTGEKRQIDYAATCGSHLVIAECKAVGMSIAFDRGDPSSIKHRIDNVVELSLSQVDEKAHWLATHPIGRNYNIAEYDYILPIAISPFVEFIPSQDIRYWVTKDLPRVLTPEEFDKLLDDIHSVTRAFNKVSLH
jgi:hypothetical protein